MIAAALIGKFLVPLNRADAFRDAAAGLLETRYPGLMRAEYRSRRRASHHEGRLYWVYVRFVKEDEADVRALALHQQAVTP